MSKNKLKKFAEMEDIPFVFQYPFAVLSEKDFPHRGKWHSEVFGNVRPITLELGCGKGEYATGLARRHPEGNYIGVDIKGARMHTGATAALREGLGNVAFLRTSIELIDRFFTPGEVAEIWITFPDPQMKKTSKRLTSTRFLDLYRRILGDGGVINLKTDSPFLFTYTKLLAEANPGAITVEAISDNLYKDYRQGEEDKVCHDLPLDLDIRTHYEQQWLDRGLTIKYIRMRLDASTPLVEPEVEIEHDTYRSYSRGQVQCPEFCAPAVRFKKQ